MKLFNTTFKTTLTLTQAFVSKEEEQLKEAQFIKSESWADTYKEILSIFNKGQEPKSEGTFTLYKKDLIK